MTDNLPAGNRQSLAFMAEPTSAEARADALRLLSETSRDSRPGCPILQAISVGCGMVAMGVTSEELAAAMRGERAMETKEEKRTAFHEMAVCAGGLPTTALASGESPPELHVYTADSEEWEGKIGSGKFKVRADFTRGLVVEMWVNGRWSEIGDERLDRIVIAATFRRLLRERASYLGGGNV